MDLTDQELSIIFNTYKKCPRCNIVKTIAEGYYLCRYECKTCRGIDLKQRRDKKREQKQQEKQDGDTPVEQE